MKTITKVTLASSLVLGAALFSLGCGSGESCCSGNSVDAKVSLLDSNNMGSNNTLPANVSTLQVSGLTSTSNSNIVKAEWIAYSDCAKTAIVDRKEVSAKDTDVTLDLQTPGSHKVCLVVTDANGLQDEDCKCVTVQETAGPTAIITGLPADMKIGCPLPALSGADSVSHSSSGTISSYSWSLDGANLGTGATPTLPSNLTDNPNPHEVCLTVTDSDGNTNMSCKNLTVKPHDKPTAVLHVLNGTTEIEDGGELNFGSSLTLNCNGSHDDCPIDANGRSIPQYNASNNGECNFNGSSYESTAADCSVLPQAGVVYPDTQTAPYYYKENCKLTGELTQSSATDGQVTVNMCGTQVFHCVKFWVDVTDQFGGTARAEKTFRVQ